MVYLKNAVAAEVAQTLRALLAVDNGAGTPAAGTASAPATGTSTGTGTGPMTGTSTRSGGAGGQPAMPSATNPGGADAAGRLAPGSAIQADNANNSLIINAPAKLAQRLKQVIAKLDQRRAQIYVEALIAEVNSETAAQFGIQWQQFGGASGTKVVGGTSFTGAASGQNILGLAQNPLTAGNGLNLGLSRGAITLANGTVIYNLVALASFLENNNNANILSTPNLVTLDNQEAQIQIGQDIPLITGSYAQQSGSTTPPFQTFDRRKVGLALRILPQVAEGGMVRLKIMQEASTVETNTLANASGPTINTRTIETSVQVQDGGMIVLGGLIQDSLADSVSQVPGLGDLPVVGNLFRYKSKRRSKNNLLVFLRPRTLRSDEADQRLSAERYDYIAGAQRDLNAQLRETGAPQLPALVERP